MSTPIAFLLAVALLVGSASEGFGQVVEGPPGSAGGLFGGRRPVDPNRTSQSLAVNIDLSGGYEQDPGQVLDTIADAPQSIEGWYTGTASTASRYYIGHSRRAIEVDGRGLLNYQDNIRDTLIGGALSVDGSTYFGRRSSNQLSVSLETSYEPGWAFGAMSAELNSEEGLASPFVIAPQQGIIEQRWFVLSGTARYQQQWSTEHQSSVQIYSGRVRPAEDSGGTESEWQNAVIAHNWALNRQVGLVATYRHSRSQSRDLEVFPGVQFQTFEAGAQLTRRLSATRLFTASFAGGATRMINAVAVLGGPASLQPSFGAEVGLSATRSVSVSASVNRGVAVLEGVSPSPMVNDSAAVTLSGVFRRRLRLAVIGNYQRSGSFVADATGSGTSNAIGGAAELRYGFARWGGIFAGFSRYRHRLQEELLVTGLPSRYDRLSARVGLTLWVPLYGSF